MSAQVMLLPQKPLVFDDLRKERAPYYVQPKFDGIRIWFDKSGVPLTRSGKRIANRQLEAQLTLTIAASPWKGHQLDGEVVLLNSLTHWFDPFETIQSMVNSTRPLNRYEEVSWRYMIFDQVPTEHLTFADRWHKLTQLGQMYMNRAQLVPTVMCLTATYVEIQCHHLISEGYEGAVVRSGGSYYKKGRATYNEHRIFKYVEWLRDEAEIVSVSEMQHNIDTSSKKIDNMIPADVLGTITVQSKNFSKPFSIGSGFTEVQRKQLWANRAALPGMRVTYKYRPGHIKDVPCPAIFVGFRPDNE